MHPARPPLCDDLTATLREAVGKDHGVRSLTGRIVRLAFSTTMATNSIVQDRLDPTGMIVSAGPGMDPEGFSVGPSYHVVAGMPGPPGIRGHAPGQGGR